MYGHQKPHFLDEVDMQNNILHTLREASHVGEKAIFHLSATPSHLHLPWAF